MVAIKPEPRNGLKQQVAQHRQELKQAAERSKAIVAQEAALKKRGAALKTPRVPKFPLPRELAWEAVPASLACTCLPTQTKQYVLKTLSERIEALKSEACRAGCKKQPDKKGIETKSHERSLLQQSRDYLASIPDCR